LKGTSEVGTGTDLPERRTEREEFGNRLPLQEIERQATVYNLRKKRKRKGEGEKLPANVDGGVREDG